MPMNTYEDTVGLATSKCQAGQLAEGIRLLREAVARQPQRAEGHESLGRALFAAGAYDDALAEADRALTIDQGRRMAHFTRGLVLFEQRRHAEALAAYDRLLDLEPGWAQAMVNRGRALHCLGRHDEALAACDAAIARDPAIDVAHHNRGDALVALRRFAQARTAYADALQLNPARLDTLTNDGVALLELGRDAEALARFESVLVRDAHSTDALFNLANYWLRAREPRRAVTLYDRLLQTRPAFATGYMNRALALAALERHAEAERDLDRTLALNPAEQGARYNRALVRLCRGEFAGGWQDYEWRLELPTATRAPSAAPQWRGRTPVAGRRIVLYAEQGLGDTIQFCRFAPMVTAQGAQVILQVQPALRRLLGALPGLDVVARDEPPPAHDVQCPLMSLPFALQAAVETLPRRAYLQAAPAKIALWQRRLSGSASRIGIVSSGRAEHLDDARRSIPLAAFAELVYAAGETYLLQQEVRVSDEAFLRAAGGRIVDVRSELRDFSDTAALIACLDLVISVDSAVAHLAGALGKPVWILLPTCPDWRWMLEREDSPWYPSARLFRQRAANDWAEVIERVRGALRAFVASTSRLRPT